MIDKVNYTVSYEMWNGEKTTEVIRAINILDAIKQVEDKCNNNYLACNINSIVIQKELM